MDGAFVYVYMRQIATFPQHYYVGMTENLQERLAAHNSGKVRHTLKVPALAHPNGCSLP